MRAEDIYRLALEQLADGGNEQAKLALAMGARVAREPSAQEGVIRELVLAQDALGRAIVANATNWTSNTDKRINEAVSHITNAIIRAR